MATHLAEGESQGRDELPEIMLQQPFPDTTFARSKFPVTAMTFGAALELANATCGTILVNNSLVNLESRNVIAESRTGDLNHVILAAARLDGVRDGPVAEDNGASAAALLMEVALGMAKLHLTQRLRFARWGAEEAGMTGSMARAGNETNCAAGA